MKAAGMGVPYLPARNMMGTDTFAYSAAKMAKCPFTGKKTVLLPALYVDIGAGKESIPYIATNALPQAKVWRMREISGKVMEEILHCCLK